MKTSDRAAIDGIILIDKPYHLSSNTVLQHVKKIFSARKAGHMGSLDPLATGMLPICFGEATKFSQFGLDADKYYTVTAHFGITTTTGDSEGEVLKSVDSVTLSATEIAKHLPLFIGQLQQTPPMYSALKHQGKKLYELARAGIEVPREARPITIYDFQLLSIEGCQAQFQVHCSKGTYIRTLIEDFGNSLGFGAHVSQLHRVYTAGFETERMYTLEELQTFSTEQLATSLLKADHMLGHFPMLELSPFLLQKLVQGQVIPNETSQTGFVRLFDEQQVFQGLGEYDPIAKVLKSKRLRSSEPC